MKTINKKRNKTKRSSRQFEPLVIPQTFSLVNKLEEIKQAGNYAVNLFYGEDIGCDDMDVKPEERKILIICHPVGCLGSVRTLFKGNLKTLEDFNPKSQPIQLSNPPKSGDYDKNGFYVWGTDDSLKSYLKRFAV